ncbi:hypothetical protein GJ685_09715, partial [Chlorobium phaeovibrioides]|nr:hypothetical protein [Chlorobium phaeovibrioides]
MAQVRVRSGYQITISGRFAEEANLQTDEMLDKGLAGTVALWFLFLLETA